MSEEKKKKKEHKCNLSATFNWMMWKAAKVFSQYKVEFRKCFKPGVRAVKYEKSVGDSHSQEFSAPLFAL